MYNLIFRKTNLASKILYIKRNKSFIANFERAKKSGINLNS